MMMMKGNNEVVGRAASDRMHVQEKLGITFFELGGGPDSAVSS
jgi:hypothetical protein